MLSNAFFFQAVLLHDVFVIFDRERKAFKVYRVDTIADYELKTPFGTREDIHPTDISFARLSQTLNGLVILVKRQGELTSEIGLYKYPDLTDPSWELHEENIIDQLLPPPFSQQLYNYTLHIAPKMLIILPSYKVDPTLMGQRVYNHVYDTYTEYKMSTEDEEEILGVDVEFGTSHWDDFVSKTSVHGHAREPYHSF